MEYNSDGKIGAEKRFATLYATRNDFINHLKEINNLVLYYLFGSIDRFDINLYNSNELIQSIFKFENYLSILISLNNKFKFEQENYFTPKSIAQQILEKNERYFKSIKLLDFIEQELQIANNRNFSYVVSLFYYFKKELKSDFPSASKFREIINDNFDLDVGRIKLSDSSNDSHKQRLSEIEKKWRKFSQN